MVVSDKKVVSVSYILHEGDKEGKVLECVNESHPLTFLFGSGHLLPKFEDNLAGLSTGDKFDFQLSSEDAYGAYNPGAVFNIPLKSFEVDGVVDYELVKIGSSIPMQDKDGNRLSGLVKSVDSETVTMDFNHPLAGSNLHFSGEVTEIRQATEEELAHDHIHQDSGCGGCSGSCGEEEGSGNCCC